MEKCPICGNTPQITTDNPTQVAIYCPGQQGNVHSFLLAEIFSRQDFEYINNLSNFPASRHGEIFQKRIKEVGSVYIPNLIRRWNIACRGGK